MSENSTFILAGNGPYDNRGCEAIVRGTVKILRHYYKDPSFLCVSNFQNEDQLKKQSLEEKDNSIIHKKTNRAYRKFDFYWFLNKTLKNTFPQINKYIIYKEMLPYIENANAILSVGGDNYSLDYGIPKLFTDLDDIVLKKRKPLIIWGASIGPFNRDPQYEYYMRDHLNKVNTIFARESVTVDYLKGIGVSKNVYRVADPAFLMDPIKPARNEIDIEKESMGLNFSPLMAKYITAGNENECIKIVSKFVSDIHKKTNLKIYLIPHVTSPHTNDYHFLKQIVENIKDSQDSVYLIPPIYNAAETKWIISKMHIFAGARTHSTIAALSSAVPTLSFSYSIKAKGINRDIFGHEKYCIDPYNLKSETITNKIESILQNYEEIHQNLLSKMPLIREEALIAGEYLKEKIDG